MCQRTAKLLMAELLVKKPPHKGHAVLASNTYFIKKIGRKA